METVYTVAQLRETRGALLRLRWSGLGHRPTVGLVATMGALHAGHSSLLARMAGECDVRLASIFVNPRQFGSADDLATYPRTLEADLAMCAAEGVDLVFVPEAGDLYPGGFDTTVCGGQLASRWEGAARPGHFDGVLTVIAKLLNICGPDRAYFGEKDFQQLRLVERMSFDLEFQSDIVACPIVREGDGLALSSRNRLLTAAQRQFAGHIHRALHEVADAFAAGERDAQVLVARGGRVLEGWTADGLSVDYFAVVDPATLEPRELAEDGDRAIIALRLGETRLIDNMALGSV